MALLCSGRCTCSASWHTEGAKLLFRKKEAGITIPFRMALPNEARHRIAARLGLCSIRKATVGPLVVSGNVRLRQGRLCATDG